MENEPKLEPFDMLRRSLVDYDERYNKRHLHMGGVGPTTHVESDASDYYNLATGPSPHGMRGMRALGPRQSRTPRDLGRSRQVGLSMVVCADCLAVADQARCHHEANCKAEPGDRVRVVTGPLDKNQTSKDVGWRFAH